VASLLIQGGDGTRRRVPLDKELTSIGRSRESDVFLADQWLSRHHAEVRRRGDGFFLIDLGSKNGTLLNAAPLTTERRLRDGDVITLGEHTLTFADELAEEAVAEGEADDQEPVGTKVFSAVELSQVVHRPAVDSAELQRQNRLLAVLAEAGASLIAHRPLPELFEHILNLLFEAVPAERGAILLLEGQPPAPAIKASRTRQGGPITRLSRSIARHVLEERVSLLLPNLMEDAAFSGQDSIMASGISSALCAPLWYTSPGEGKDAVIGLVYLDTRNLTQAFGEEDLKVVTVLANVAAAKIENARLLEESLEKRRLEEDMRIAADIQRRLLPESAPQLDGWGLVGSNRPCRAIGGDYFDFALESGRLLLALGDVSGKGTGAALLMTVLRAAVRAHWTHEDLAVAVSRINRTVFQNIPQGK
jgi:sigma-B regulation protein RsbU (phosphoserine phosphatase)